MNGLSTLSRMMHRPAPPSGPSPSTGSGSDSRSPTSAHASALAAASAVGDEELDATSPISPGGAGGGGMPFYRGPAEGRPTLGMRAGLGAGAAGRPPLGPRGSSTGPPVGNTGLAGGAGAGGGMHPTLTLASPEGMQQQKIKQVQYDYRYDDTDNMMHELEEFFPYVEMPKLEEYERAFADDFGRDWTEATMEERKVYISRQLDLLEHHSSDMRIQSATRLFYLLQGNFRYTNGPEHQLHWIIENAKLFRACDGIPSTLVALQAAGARHDRLAHTSAEPALRQSFSAAGQRADSGPSAAESDEASQKMDSANAEVALYIGLLYFCVEVFRGDEAFAEELMALQTPLPVYLLTTVAGLREKSAKGYPVKKLLLLVWKTLLACLGGIKDCKAAVRLQRELAGIPEGQDSYIKATPIGLNHFRQDTSTKYPSFEPYSATEVVPVAKLAEAIKAIPPRSNYHAIAKDPGGRGSNEGGGSQGKAPAPTSLPQPGTPAPTPPPTPPPKAKKQQYQTDPSRPFVFPFSRQSDGPQRLVPYAIDEADRLYKSHMHVSLGLHQLYVAREEYMREERGLGKSGLLGLSDMSLNDDDDDNVADAAWEEFRPADWRFEEQAIMCESKGDSAGVKVANEKRASLKKLHRTEVIYRSILPCSQSIVVVLLKLLLATVTASPNNNAQTVGSPGAQDPTDTGQPAAPQTLEEVDVARHREITSKAVSAILLLLLKWFKASHILKEQYLATLLIDSNCLLLILKMFGLQELLSTIQTKNEWEDNNFFRYCYQHFAKDAEARRPEENLQGRPKPASTQKAPDGEEIELLTDYSWRNFFSAISFVRILHELTKERPARITLLVQYKSTQILKRMLRVPHPMLQLEILKVIKSQVPFCGRKWRQSNMKTITAIYLNCKPGLRDEWLAVTDVDNDVDDSNSAEAGLRTLIRFYHNQHYTKFLPNTAEEQLHRRSNSLAGPGVSAMDDGGAVTSPGALKRSTSGVFPPNRTSLSIATSNDPAADLDGIMSAWLYDYDDLLGDLLEPTADGQRVDAHALPLWLSGVAPTGTRGDPAWARLDAIMRARGALPEESISDSESIVSIGELDQDGAFDDSDMDEARQLDLDLPGGQAVSENENTWAHISPHALSLLPRSPQERMRRRSSSGSGRLRPVLPAAGAEWLEDSLDDEEEPGPMPIQGGTADEEERMNAPVDEVEYAFQV